MGNQNFSFMEFLESKLLNGQKRRTNRPDDNYRDKCNVGDVMHIFVKMRTPESRWLFDAVVKKKVKWQIDDAPEESKIAKEKNGPISNETWYKFAITDGFKNYSDFLEYFQNHPKKARNFICFVFKRLLTIEDFLPALEKIYQDEEIKC